jgi:hypothetical protein
MPLLVEGSVSGVDVERVHALVSVVGRQRGLGIAAGEVDVAPVTRGGVAEGIDVPPQ